VGSGSTARKISKREAKLRVLLLALFEVVGNNSDDARVSRLTHEEHGDFRPAARRKYVCGWCGGRGCARCSGTGLLHVEESDPYSRDLPEGVGVRPVDIDAERSRHKQRRHDGFIEKSEAADGSELPWQRRDRLIYNLGPTMPLLLRSIERLRLERPELYEQLERANPETLRWLSRAIDAGISVPSWARAKYETEVKAA
jgi:hypothetical protein